MDAETANECNVEVISASKEEEEYKYVSSNDYE